MRWTARCLFLCLLLALAPAASARSVATLDVGAAEGVGSNLLEGDLLAFRSTGPREASPAPGAFHLEAQRLRVEADGERGSSVATVGLLPSSLSSVSVDHGTARASGAGIGQDTDVFLAALPGGAAPRVRIEAQRLGLSAADGTPVEAQRFVNSERPAVRVGTLGGHAADFDGGATIVVEGDFLLILWDWRLNVETPRGTSEYVSGRAELGGTAGVVHEVRLRQLYVFATDARLEFQVERADSLSLLVDAREWRVDGDVRFQEATGSLRVDGGSVAVLAPEMVLEGAFRIALGRATGGTLPLVVRGEGEARAHLAGDVYQIAPAGDRPWRLLAILAACAVLAAGAFVLRRDVGGRAFRAMESAMDAGRYDEVLRLGPRLLQGPHGGNAALALGTIHLRHDRAREALACLQKPRRWEEDLLGSRAFLSAVGHAALGDPSRARQDLGESLRRDPMLEAEARRHPALRRLLPDLLDRDVV